MQDYCLHIHDEEQKCIYNLSSVCVRALDYPGLLNGNDPVGHHGILVADGCWDTIKLLMYAFNVF